MPSTFAVIDAGSNAFRLQIASVDQPGTYRIIEQDRRAVRLGRGVFQTGTLDPDARQQALEALKRFKNLADKHEASAIRAVATSAMREARDSAAFVQDAAALGIPLEILSEEDEARLISLGILSGLSFDPPLGLFVDIGGGSVELALGNRSSNQALFSIPAGAVRFTERYLRRDPPESRELAAMNRAINQKLEPAVRRLKHAKFTMAFGSGGTLTALSDVDSRLTGEPRENSLYVLRKLRIKSLYDILRSQRSKEREALVPGDSRRADILVAGAAVLLAVLNKLDLDYIFVSDRGLRDGLMIDQLRKQHPAFVGAWAEAAPRSESLEEFGEKFNYDKAHSQQVSKLALSLFEQLKDCHKLPNRYSGVLHAAAMLHDVGLYIGYESTTSIPTISLRARARGDSTRRTWTSSPILRDTTGSRIQV